MASVTALNDAIGDGAILAAATLKGIPIVGVRARLRSNEPRNTCRQNQETAHGPLRGLQTIKLVAPYTPWQRTQFVGENLDCGHSIAVCPQPEPVVVAKEELPITDDRTSHQQQRDG
jgi:hypothetical protein